MKFNYLFILPLALSFSASAQSAPSSQDSAPAERMVSFTSPPDSVGVMSFIFPGLAFQVTVPEGWSVDRVHDLSPYVPAHFWPTGPSKPGASSAMEFTTAEKDELMYASATAMRDYDLSQMRKKDPKINLEAMPPVVSMSGSHIAVYRIQSGKTPSREAIAYIEEKKQIVIAHLVSDLPADHEIAYSAFRRLLSSYHFMTDEVVVHDETTNSGAAPANAASGSSPGAGSQTTGSDDARDDQSPEGFVMPYFDDFWFKVQTPKDWMHLHVNGQNGVIEAWVPKGNEWDSAYCRIYLNSSDKRQAGNETLAKIMDGDVAQAREQSPHVKMKPLGDWPIGSAKVARVHQFTGDSHNNVEAVAYVDETTHVAFLVFTCKNDGSFKKALPVFRTFVNSYERLSEMFNTSMLSRPAVSAIGQVKDNEHRVVWNSQTFTVTAPSGWILDNQSGKKENLQVVTYPKGANWGDGPVVAYINFADKAVKGNETVAGVMAYDEEHLKQRTTTMTVKPGADFVTGDGRTTPSRNFFGSDGGEYETTVYVDEPGVIVLLVFSARSQKEYEGALPSFREWVKAYRNLSVIPSQPAKNDVR